MFFALCFDVLQLFDGLRGFLYERKHGTRGQLDVRVGDAEGAVREEWGACGK
jgi:hypothetical protein